MEKQQSAVENTMQSLKTSLRLEGWNILEQETDEGTLHIYNRYAGKIRQETLDQIRNQFDAGEHMGLPSRFNLELIDRPPEEIIDAVNRTGYHSHHEFIPSDQLICFWYLGEADQETVDIICQLSELTRPVRNPGVVGKFVSKLTRKKD